MKKDKDLHVENEAELNELSEDTPTEEASEDGSTEELSVEDRLKGELSALNDRHVRLYAEFDNYKRRTAKERVELMQSAAKDVIGDLLPVLDDFDRALKMMENASDVAAVKEGVELISNKLKSVLQKQGLKEMQVVGEAFDADFQEAITNVPAPSDDLKGKVIDEVEKGYFLNDRVLRYAKVVVGN